jgi:PilZ domain-containing protein
VRHQKDLGDRKEPRVDYQRAGFIIPAPDAPWVECTICNVSDGGLRVDAGSLAVPEVFAVSFTSGGEVLRLCRKVWRHGGLIGAQFVSVSQLREQMPEEH